MRYDLKNKETGEVSEWSMAYSQLESFLIEHPELEVVFLTMNVGDPVILGAKKVPSDFRNHIIKPMETRLFGKPRETKFHS